MKNSENLDKFKLYAKPGTNFVISAQLWNVPEGFVCVQSYPPNESYIADKTGEWIYPTDDVVRKMTDAVKKQRKEMILKAYPVDVQLNAILEFIDGDDTKIKEIIEGIKKIKENFPKLKYK